MGHWKRAVVVGASSGIGEAMARQLAMAGTRVALVARRMPELERIATELNERAGLEVAIALEGDVRDSEHAVALFHTVVDRLAGLDLVVYSSGIMPAGAHTGYPTDADISAIETNFVGAVSWLNEAAKYFLEQESGTIVGIGSIAGERGRRGNPVYNATKAALAVYLESLRSRLAKHRITVLTAKPGFVRTPLIGSRAVFPPAVSAEDAATRILEAAAKGRRVVYVPWWWRLLAVLVRATPSAVMERLPV